MSLGVSQGLRRGKGQASGEPSQDVGVVIMSVSVREDQRMLLPAEQKKNN